MAIRWFLALSTPIWLGYGIYCFLEPGSLAGAAGIGALTATGTTELRAMYGGLQAALGVLCLCGVLWVSMRRPALVALSFMTGGLALARFAAAFVDGSFGEYSNFALVFEVTSSAIAIGLLRSGSRAELGL